MARRRGSVLVLVLFILVVLAMAALSFAFRAGMAMEMAVTRSRQARLRVHASSAVAIGMARLAADDNDFDHPGEAWGTHAPLGREQWLDDWSEQAGEDGPVFVTDFQVVDEEGKLNFLSLLTLRRELVSRTRLAKLGMTTEQIDSLSDWIDADDVARAEGGESQYYSQRQPALRPKNGPLAALSELLTIRGFSPSDYYGEDIDHDGVLDRCEDDGDISDPLDDGDGELKRGWVDLLTCLGDGRVNLNTAPIEVLKALLSERAADQIDGYRTYSDHSVGDVEDHALRSFEDLERLQGLDVDEDMPILEQVGRFDSEHFRIHVRARHVPTGMTYRLDVLVRASENGVAILRWKVVR